MKLLKKYKLIIALTLFILAGTGLVLGNQFLIAQDDVEQGLEPGQQPPAFTLENLAGEEVSLTDFEGKYVLLNFWTTWCPSCRAEMPHLERLQTEYSDQVAVLSINYGEDQAAVSAFKEEENLENINFLLDTTREVGSNYLVRGVPTNYFLDQDGLIITRVVGYMEYEDIVNQLDLD